MDVTYTITQCAFDELVLLRKAQVVKSEALQNNYVRFCRLAIRLVSDRRLDIYAQPANNRSF